jgi:hypothetical protein
MKSVEQIIGYLEGQHKAYEGCDPHDYRTTIAYFIEGLLEYIKEDT